MLATAALVAAGVLSVGIVWALKRLMFQGYDQAKVCAGHKHK